MVVKGKSERGAGVSFNETVVINTPADSSEDVDEQQDEFADKKNYSLDSDEEDNRQQRIRKLDIEEIEGQEETTIREDGGQKITPFNLEEENDEGHFDENGNFIFDKKGEEIRDSWLDSIDNQKLPVGIPLKDFSKDSTPDPLSKLSPTEILQQIIAILKPTESVTKALQRLGGSQLSASQRLKLKKKGQLPKDCQADKEQLEKLTSLCDWLLNEGKEDIYQDTYEKISHEIKQASEDIFADDDEAGSSSNKRVKFNESVAKIEVMWYYRFAGVTHGPFSSSDMFKMQDESVFKPGTEVCKESNKELYYDAKRINFDDYID